MNEPKVTIKFTKVERITDSMVIVRTTKGTAITVHKPDDLTLKMSAENPGEGTVLVQKALLAGGTK